MLSSSFSFFSPIILSLKPISFSVSSLFVVRAIFLSYNFSSYLTWAIASLYLMSMFRSIISSNLVFYYFTFLSLSIWSFNSYLYYSYFLFCSKSLFAFTSATTFLSYYLIYLICSSYYLCLFIMLYIFLRSIPTTSVNV